MDGGVANPEAEDLSFLGVAQAELFGSGEGVGGDREVSCDEFDRHDFPVVPFFYVGADLGFVEFVPTLGDFRAAVG